MITCPSCEAAIEIATYNNVTIPIATRSGTSPVLPPERVKELVALIQRKLLEQGRRNRKREDRDGG